MRLVITSFSLVNKFVNKMRQIWGTFRRLHKRGNVKCVFLQVFFVLRAKKFAGTESPQNLCAPSKAKSPLDDLVV